MCECPVSFGICASVWFYFFRIFCFFFSSFYEYFLEADAWACVLKAMRVSELWVSMLFLKKRKEVHQVSSWSWVGENNFFFSIRQITVDVRCWREVVRHMDMAHHKMYLSFSFYLFVTYFVHISPFIQHTRTLYSTASTNTMWRRVCVCLCVCVWATSTFNGSQCHKFSMP